MGATRLHTQNLEDNCSSGLSRSVVLLYAASRARDETCHHTSQTKKKRLIVEAPQSRSESSSAICFKYRFRVAWEHGLSLIQTHNLANGAVMTAFDHLGGRDAPHDLTAGTTRCF